MTVMDFTLTEIDNQDLFFDPPPSVGVRPPKGILEKSVIAEANLDYRWLVDSYNYDLETGEFTRWRAHHKSAKKAGEPVGTVYAHQNTPYRFVFIDGRWFLIHRLAYLWVVGHPALLNIDHRDGDSLNNKWENLRLADRSQNNFNKGINQNNKTGYKGVSQTRAGNYIAVIGEYGKTHFLGTFATPEEAHEAYVRAAIKLHKAYARLHGLTAPGQTSSPKAAQQIFNAFSGRAC